LKKCIHLLWHRRYFSECQLSDNIRNSIDFVLALVRFNHASLYEAEVNSSGFNDDLEVFVCEVNSERFDVDSEGEVRCNRYYQADIREDPKAWCGDS
jgi:hypothetical protein